MRLLLVEDTETECAGGRRCYLDRWCETEVVAVIIVKLQLHCTTRGKQLPSLWPQLASLHFHDFHENA